MNEITKEVKAQEIHERAVGFYKISEQYGYKFLMEVKAIRDEKLFKELGFKTFEEYSINNFGYSNDTMNERIKAANEFGEDYNGALRSYGKHKTHQLATMPKEQREDIIQNGIETKNGKKTIEEATTRELEDYKKRNKSLEQQNAQLQLQVEQAQRSEQLAIDQLESEQNKPTETKVEYKEVIPDKVKRQLEQIENNKKLLQQKEKENREIREQLRKQQEELRKQQEKDEDKEYWDILTDDEIISRKRVYAETNLLEIKEYADEFLNKVSINAFRDAAIAKSSRRTKNMIYETADEVIRWAENMKNKLNTNQFVEDAEYREEF